MRRALSFKHPIYFNHLLIKITILIVLTVLALSLILNYSFKSYSISQLNSSNEKLMNQILQNALAINDYAKSFATSMFNGPDAANLMYGQDVQIIDILKSMRNTDIFLSSTPYMHSAYFYNGRSGTYYLIGPDTGIRTTMDILDHDFAHMIENPERIKSLTPIPRSIRFSEANAEKKIEVFSYILSEHFPNSKKVKNALIVNLRMDWIFNTLSSYKDTNSLEGSNILLLDSEGKVVTNSNSENKLFGVDLSAEPFVSEILASKQRSGFMIADYQNQSSVITYATYNSAPWTLVNITPYELIAESIGKVKRTTLSIGLIIMILCTFSAFLLARNLYAPIRDLRYMARKLDYLQSENQDERNEFDYIASSLQSASHKLISLESFRKSNLSILKQNYLRDVILNNNSSEVNDETHFKEHGIVLNPKSRLVVVLFKIDHFSDFQAKYSLKDQTLMKYALQNIIREILYSSFPCETWDEGGDTIFALLNVEPDNSELQQSFSDIEEFKKLIREVQNVYATYFKTSLSVFISHSGESLREGRRLFEEAVELSKYRMTFGHGSVLFQQEMDIDSLSEYNIDNELTTQFLEMLKKGRLDEACMLLNSLMKSLSNCSYNNIMFTLSHLSSSIFNAINLMEKNGTVLFALDFVSFDNRIKNMETLEQINAEFLKLIEFIVLRMEQSRDEKSEIVALNAIKYIEVHYTDPSLTTNQVADQFNMTPAYLGKMFRQHASRSITDYISEVRLVKASELLKESAYNIDEIIDKIGWENKKYFFTLFKKRFGATPTEYRLKSRVNEISKTER
jgi:two-component system response regulator YesN